MRHLLFFLLIISAISANAQQGLVFHSLDELFRYADDNSVTFRNATQQTILAKYTTLAARFAQFNLQANAALATTDFEKMPEKFLPAQLLGGQPGKYKEISFGLQYQNNLSWLPQIDIISPYAAAKVRVAQANERLVAAGNQLAKKDLYESLAAAYYGILSTGWQITVTRKSLAVADTLVQILQNKLREGIARPQDVSGGQANELATKDRLQQLEVQATEQLNSLRVLCDIDPAIAVSITPAEEAAGAFDASLIPTGHLGSDQSEWQKRYLDADLRAAKRWWAPTLTAFGDINFQQNSNDHPYDNNPWIASNYIGLKVTVPLFPDANKIAAVRYDRVNLRIAENNFQHARLKDSLDNSQLQLDYQKAAQSYANARAIEALKADTYYKNLNIYKDNILSATDLLNSYIDWLNYRLSAVSNLAVSEYSKSKIIINNLVK